MHKLGCLFFFLGNTRPQFRSTLKNIHLVAVGRSSDIQTYGINAFLSPLVEDLKKLYCDGINVCINGEVCVIHGTLLAFLADTLAAHMVGGFKGSMSFALRVCRTCLITPQQLPSCFSETTCTVRTPEIHFNHCSVLEGPLQAHYSTSYGVNFYSILEDVPGFSVVNGLPHDIMHDLYEGIVPYELKLLLCYCLDQTFFTVDELNGRIDRFGFPTDSKPRLIDRNIGSDESKVKQSASQMLTLSQQFPILIGDKVPFDDPCWNHFLLLLKICKISNSIICTPDTIAYLRILIEEKLEIFQRIYPSAKFLPKHHYMVHYPSQIERLGPLIHSWTMRHEAKLNFVKKISRQSNFKNICKTVAKKHLFQTCFQLQKDQNLLKPSVTFSSKVKTCTLLHEDQCVKDEFSQVSPTFDLHSEIKHFDWVKLQSSMLQKGTFVLLSSDVYTPVFGLIADVLCHGDIILLYYEKYISELFDSHYNAFKIKNAGEFGIVNVSNLFDHRPVIVKRNFVPLNNDMYAILFYSY